MKKSFKFTLINLILILHGYSFLISGPYSRWANGPPDDPYFFPIAVWLQAPSSAQKYKDIGINTFIGLWQGPTEAQLSALKANGMHVVCSQNTTGLTSSNKDMIWSWMQEDEPDNAQSDGKGGYLPCIDPVAIQNLYTEMKQKDNSRPVYLNFGRGVAYENWIGRGTCTGNLGMYPEYIKGADIISFDIYPVTSKDIANGKLEYVATGVERLVQWAKGEKIVWDIVETTHINSDVRPTPEQIKTEVWMSLIHGSMGIGYFVHEWVPSFKEDGIFRYPEIVQAIKNINQEITALAPVLNTPSIENSATVTSAVPIKHMVKRHGDYLYLFAVVMRNESVSANISITTIPENTAAEVLGENRSITVANRTFQDTFAPYGVHLYKIKIAQYIEPEPDPEPDPEADPDPDPIPFDKVLETRIRIDRNIIATNDSITAVIEVFIKEADYVTLKIYNTAGKEVKSLISGHCESGSVIKEWDGKDNNGKAVGSGIYIVYMETGSFNATKKIAVVH